MSKYFEIDAKSKFRTPKVASQATHTHSGIVDKTRMIYSEADERLYIGGLSAWIGISTPYDVLDQGTKMLFGSYPLPTGWSLDTTWNDRVILLETNAAQIGNTGGSWTITGILGAGSHTHSFIDHATVSVDNDYGPKWLPSVYHGHKLSSDNSHTHSQSGSWRPYNIRYCVGEYQ